MKGRKLIRDAVHGDIELGALEVELMDTPEFQRLRGIKQLGTAYLVYPSAMHTRFEHSLGASWMANRIIHAVRRTHHLSEDEENLIRVAALLHDITHIPFGHTLEDERRVLPRHDKDEARVDHFLKRSNIGRILEREGIQQAVINAIYGGDTLRSDIIGGPISSDLLDYLRRDTYFCGLSQYYDQRVFKSFVIQDGRLMMNLEKNGMLRRDALSELENLLRIRYTLSERVYFHHTKVASGAMISKAVELALQEGFDPKELRNLRDDTLMWVLRERYAGNAGIRHLLNSLESRQLYRPCYVLTIDIGEVRRKQIVDKYHFSTQSREEAEREIAKAAGIEEQDILIYCPSFGMSMPETELPVLFPSPSGSKTPLPEGEGFSILKEKHKALWKFSVLLDRRVWDKREQVVKAVNEYL